MRNPFVVLLTSQLLGKVALGTNQTATASKARGVLVLHRHLSIDWCFGGSREILVATGKAIRENKVNSIAIKMHVLDRGSPKVCHVWLPDAIGCILQSISIELGGG